MNSKKIFFIVLLTIFISFTYAQKTMKRYLVKSGIIEYKYEGSMKGKETLYFDDYGTKEVKFTESEMTMMGMTQKTNAITIMDKDWVYSINLDTKTGTKMKNPAKEIFESLKNDEKKIQKFGEEMMIQFGGKRIGNEKVLGKDCEVWEIAQFGTKSYVWNYIPLKSTTEMMGMKINIIATKIDTEAKIPADKFKIPAGIKLQEIDNMQGIPGM